MSDYVDKTTAPPSRFSFCSGWCILCVFYRSENGSCFLAEKASCDIDISIRVYCECNSLVNAIARPVVSGHPKQITAGIVINCRIVVRSTFSSTFSRHIDIACGIHDKSRSTVNAIARPVVSGHP